MTKRDVMEENELILKQRNSRGFMTQIKLINGRELQVIRNTKKIKQSYSVDILSLQERSKLITVIAWNWLITCVGFILLTLLLLKFSPPYLGNDNFFYLGIILVTGFLGCALSFVQFLKNTSKQQIFFSKNANVPIIKLNKGKPTKEVFSTFINSIQKRITEFQAHMDIAEENQLIGEMKMLRRLSDSGVISKKSYELAKETLFNGFDSQVINRDNVS